MIFGELEKFDEAEKSSSCHFEERRRRKISRYLGSIAVAGDDQLRISGLFTRPAEVGFTVIAAKDLNRPGQPPNDTRNPLDRTDSLPCPA